MIIDLLEKSLIVLQVACSGMEMQNAHENILVVGQICHCLDKPNPGVLSRKWYMYILVHISMCIEYTCMYIVYTSIIVV
jgi:hypothetical protein